MILKLFATLSAIAFLAFLLWGFPLRPQRSATIRWRIGMTIALIAVFLLLRKLW